MSKLHEAVHRTTNKLLDTPKYVVLTRAETTPLEMRLLGILTKLGYVKLKPPISAPPIWEVHPEAFKYFKRYGEQYVQLLEATQRLTQ